VAAAASVPLAYERHMTPALFEPWARELVTRAAIRPGAAVLDVACGPGTVARLAAAAAGSGGRVVACDVSAAMLELARGGAAQADAAPVRFVQCAAGQLDVGDSRFQVVLCQQGLQFFPDRLGAVREMARVLEPGGAAFISVWAAERPLGLFGPMLAALHAAAVAEPFPRAFDATSYALGAGELRELLEAGGFDDVAVETVELECVWASGEEAVATLAGSPFGPLVAALSPAERERIVAGFRERLGCVGDREVRVRTASNVARGSR